MTFSSAKLSSLRNKYVITIFFFFCCHPLIANLCYKNHPSWDWYKSIHFYNQYSTNWFGFLGCLWLSHPPMYKTPGRTVFARPESKRQQTWTYIESTQAPFLGSPLVSFNYTRRWTIFGWLKEWRLQRPRLGDLAVFWSRRKWFLKLLELSG